MRLLAISLLAASAMLLSGGCIQERSDDNNSGSYEDRDNSPEDNDGDDDNNDDWEDSSPRCAEAPSGTGSWEDEGEDGLHCNYLRDGTDDWAYTLNSSESYCMEMSWAPNQDGGYLRYWYDNGNAGCDWVISW